MFFCNTLRNGPDLHCAIEQLANNTSLGSFIIHIAKQCETVLNGFHSLAVWYMFTAFCLLWLCGYDIVTHYAVCDLSEQRDFTSCMYHFFLHFAVIPFKQGNTVRIFEYHLLYTRVYVITH